MPFFFYFSVGCGGETIFFMLGGGSLENKFCWGGDLMTRKFSG